LKKTPTSRTCRWVKEKKTTCFRRQNDKRRGHDGGEKRRGAGGEVKKGRKEPGNQATSTKMGKCTSVRKSV